MGRKFGRDLDSGRRVRRRLLTAACLVALPLIAAAPAQAVTIGQLAPGSPPSAICGFQQLDTVQTIVTSGNDYVVPPYGATVVSWSTNAASSGGNPQLYTFKVFRQVGPSSFMVVGHDGPRQLTDNALNSFPTNIPVQPGDRIGLYWNTGGFSTACEFDAAPADDFLERPGSLPDGGSGDFSPHGGGDRLNVTAEIKPSNAFTLGRVRKNKKRGTASVAATVPGPGELTVAGSGVRAGSAIAVESVSTSGPGTVLVAIRPRGKTKSRLRATGKAKVRPTITYTPTGGDPSSLTTKVKLKLRR